MVYKEYSWKVTGVGCSAQDAGETISEIEKRDGVVTKESFLEASRPIEAPTHNAFEWNDSVAAEKYRLEQSGRIIRNLCVKIIKDDKPEKVTAYVNINKTTADNARYMSLQVALEDDENRSAVLENALNELRLFKRKYETLSELAEVFTAIDKAVRS